MKIREDIAALLRAGVPYSTIRTQLGVGNSTIIRVRNAIGMPPGRPGTPQTDEQRHAATLKRHPKAAAMLRNGATYTQVHDTLGLSRPTIRSIRVALNIPVPANATPARTPADAFALYARPHTDGHTHWTGPHTGTTPQLWADGRVYSALRIAFRLHHDREPDGPIRRGGNNCDDPHCINGAHLTDRRIREANHRADQAFEQIFGP